MPRVPIPNQPSFVFNYNLLTINMSGSVVNRKNKVATLYAHGNIIRGTQTIVGVPVVWTGFSHKGRIFVHGYFLTPYTPFAATRFRIPLIVSIWKLYLGYCNVIANMTETTQDTVVYASTEIETESLDSCVMLSAGPESVDHMTGHFNVNAITRNRHTFSALLSPLDRPIKFAVSLTGIWKSLRYKLFTKPLPVEQYKPTTAVVRPLPVEQLKQVSAHVDTLPMVQEKQAKVNAHADNMILQNTCKLSVFLVRSIVDGVYNVWVKAANSMLRQKHRLEAKLHKQDTQRITKMSVHLVSPFAQYVAKVQVHLLEPIIQSLHRLKVHLQPKFIEGLLGRIQWLLSGRKIQQRGYTKFDAIKLKQKSSIRMTGRAYEHGKFRVGLQLMANKAARLLHIHATDWAQKEGLLRVHSNQVKGDNHRHIMMSTGETINEVKLSLNCTWIEELVELNIDVIPGLAERYVLMKPAEVPQVKWLNLLVTVMNTETLSFIRFTIDELVQDPTVHISMFDHEVISLLQWYIHGGVINNEGYGNEVIFDLGEADDGSSGGGTIPPIPSRQWSGGYVEDPFKGVGYEPTSNSTGYVSPKVSQWISGSKMYWGKSTEPFQEA